jgi:hypothetical protein
MLPISSHLSFLEKNYIITKTQKILIIQNKRAKALQNWATNARAIALLVLIANLWETTEKYKAV